MWKSLAAGLALSLVAGSALAQSVPQSITPVTTAANAATLVVKNSPARLFSAYASGLTGGTSGFLLLINATSAPADGSLTGCGTAGASGCLMDCVPFTNGIAQVNDGDISAPFNTGIVAVVSSATSCFTKTTGTLTAFIGARGY